MRSMPKRYYAWGLGALIILSLAVYLSLPSGRWEVKFLDVGQGDSVLIRTPRGEKILVDAGPDTTVTEEVGSNLGFFENHIDLLVFSHTDSDHITGAVEILRRYNVGMIMLPVGANNSAVYREVLKEIEGQNVPVLWADAGTDFCFAEVCVDTLWPKEGIYDVDNRNNLSLVMRWGYGDTSLLLTGDIEREVEYELLRNGYLLSADVLKIPHHGSKGSSSEGLLCASAADRAVVSVGADNYFGHPHKETLDRINKSSQKIYRTDQEGVIEFWSDGKRWINK